MTMFPIFIPLPPPPNGGYNIWPRKYWWIYLLAGLAWFGGFTYLLASDRFFEFVYGHDDHALLWIVAFALSWVGGATALTSFGLLGGKEDD